MKLPDFDILKARAETPGCQDVLHFNNAGAALMPAPVVESVIQYTRLESKWGGYEAASIETQRLDQTYSAAAKLLNCRPSEIAYSESATRAWDMAFYSIPFKEGDFILTGMSEYESNYLAFLHVCKKTGAKIEIIPNDDSGQISLAALKNRIDRNVKLIAITHVPTNGGLINPAEEIGNLAQNANILYLLDSCQAAGQLNLDVNKLKCDFLSFTGRKFIRGPRGTGILYVKDSVAQKLEPPFIDLHTSEWISDQEYKLAAGARRFEQWEQNYAAKLGLGVAIDYALAWGIDAIEKRIEKLSQELRSKLKAIPGITLHDLGLRQCGIVSFRVKDKDPQKVQEILARKNINISVSMKRYTRLDMESRNLNSVCRASIHYYNTSDEIDRFCLEIQKLI